MQMRRRNVRVQNWIVSSTFSSCSLSRAQKVANNSLYEGLRNKNCTVRSGRMDLTRKGSGCSWKTSSSFKTIQVIETWEFLQIEERINDMRKMSLAKRDQLTKLHLQKPPPVQVVTPEKKNKKISKPEVRRKFIISRCLSYQSLLWFMFGWHFSTWVTQAASFRLSVVNR